jgi:hypothetical protein
MSRTNPFKQKPRQAKKTVLVVGEGSTEKAFCDYLKSLYLIREAGVSVTVRSADGGSPQTMLYKAIRWMECDAYDSGIVLLDGDIDITASDKKKALRKHIAILLTAPCIEGLFLALFEHPGFNPSTWNSDLCKRTFHEKYLSQEEKTEKDKYGKIFSKEILDKNVSVTDLLRKTLVVATTLDIADFKQWFTT